MKRVGKMAVFLAGGLAFVAGAQADDSARLNNPYAPIVARNVFGINPPSLVDTNQLNTEPPPKITPNGTMSILGHLQVLFKTSSPVKPGQPAKDQFYILTEGQQQDDIEVTKIDEKAGIVTFNNHGAVQELPLAVATASGPSTPAQGGPGPAPNFPKPMVTPGGNPGSAGGFVSFGNRPGPGVGPAVGPGGRIPTGAGGTSFNSGRNPGASLGGGFGTAPTRSYTSQQPQTTIPAEDQMILITAQHLKAQQEGDPAVAIYPPTPLDAAAGITPNAAAPPTAPPSGSPQR